MKTTYHIEDNFLGDEDFCHLESLLMGMYFPWFYNDRRVRKGDGQYQFVHQFYRDYCPQSEFISCLDPILEQLHPAALIRIKANLNPKSDKIKDSLYHCDMGGGGWTTGIYYVNTNNGYTLFEDGTKVKCVANRFVSFPSTLKHAGSTCTDDNTRVVININYVQGNPSRKDEFKNIFFAQNNL